MGHSGAHAQDLKGAGHAAAYAASSHGSVHPIASWQQKLRQMGRQGARDLASEPHVLAGSDAATVAAGSHRALAERGEQPGIPDTMHCI